MFIISTADKSGVASGRKYPKLFHMRRRALQIIHLGAKNFYHASQNIVVVLTVHIVSREPRAILAMLGLVGGLFPEFLYGGIFHQYCE